MPDNRSRTLYICLIAILLVSIWIFKTQPAGAGKLEKFESGVSEDNVTPPPPEDEEEDDNDLYYCSATTLADDPWGLVFLMGLFGGVNSWESVQEDASSEILREKGEHYLPFIALDIAYQQIEEDLEGMDYRGELGYGPFAGQARLTTYQEGSPATDDLDVVQIHGLYRMSFTKVLEIDFGIGTMNVTGEEYYSGVSCTLPILIRPIDYVGLEFRPAWATINGNDVEDYDLSLLLGRRFAFLRVGYRWLKNDAQTLDGAYLGMAWRY